MEEGQERYAFTWPGKADAIRQSQTPSTATLRPCPEKSRGRDGQDGSFDSDNIYIEGDNLEVLKLLQRGYHGKVKMIYIDPPYNTGHDFVYKDKFGDTIANYKEQAGLAGQSNPDTSGRYHSDWCSMMYPRLRLARELLSEDGVIFISIDDAEVTNLNAICDEIFGSNCHQATITWRRKRGKDNSTTGFSRLHEYALVYSKTTHFIPNRLPMGDERISVYANPDNDPKGAYVLQPAWASGMKKGPTYSIQLGDVFFDNRMWLYSETTLRDAYDDGRLAIKGLHKDGKPNVYLKVYLNENKGIIPDTIWSDAGNTGDAVGEIKQLFDGAIPFGTPKPLRYIDRMLRIGCGKDDVVLDFFSGSATTAEALLRLNIEAGSACEYIMVQLPEMCAENTPASQLGFTTLCDIGEERIRRAGDKIKAELAESNRQLKLGEEPKTLPDVGFRVFTLDDSGIDRPRPGELALDVVKADRTDMDIVFEMMLKWGLELTLPVEREDAAGYPVYSVACGELVCCLAQGLTMEALQAIADMEPRRVLMRDSILTDTLKLNALQVFRHAGERMGVEIELRTV